MPTKQKIELILKYFIIFIAIICIAAASAFQINSPDLFWHLKMGVDLLNLGLSPFVDHYSFTMHGEPIILVAWPFQIIISILYSAFGGLKGIIIYRFIVWTAGLAVLWFLLEKKRTPILLRGLAVGFFLFAVIYHSEPRPDLLSLTLELGMLVFCFKWREQLEAKTAIVIAVLLLIWTNFHISSLFGYVIVGAFIAEQLIISFQQRSLARLKTVLIWAVIWNAIGFINHDFIHPLLGQKALSPDWNQYITEYLTRPFFEQEITLQIFWVLIVLTLPILALTQEWAGLIILFAVAFKTWTMSKLYPHLIVVGLIFVVTSLIWLQRKINEQGWKTAHQFFSASLIALTVLVLFFQITDSLLRPIYPRSVDIDGSFFGAKTVEYMKTNNYQGNILNDYSLGGFVLFSLAPQIKVYIDGRTNILYPLEHAKRFTTTNTDLNVFKEEVDKYDISYVLARVSTTSELLYTALFSQKFSIDFVDSSSALLSRKTGRFPMAELAWVSPECIKESHAEKIHQELMRASADLPVDSALTQTLSDIENYFKYKKPVFYTSTNFSNSSFYKRLSAELALRSQQPQLAQKFLQSIDYKSGPDVIHLAELDCELNGCLLAEQLLTKVPAMGMSDYHIYRAYRLLLNLKQKVGLKIFTDERLEKSRVKVADLVRKNAPASWADTCPVR